MCTCVPKKYECRYVIILRKMSDDDDDARREYYGMYMYVLHSKQKLNHNEPTTNITFQELQKFSSFLSLL